ncbi:NADH-quinone oxidoreductase subunit NuoG [Candidatus Ichthyocystis sparus]|uniref:NADH-quinone oxidoreductase subunit NuoG n=1 Tax=Candidatus Ichthyocystis sparus TaxID=1561004 RepID=UPI000ABA33F8|nr:NADH-quinone oxidoreductase subunit NuoG [Candidatus Ichthyocystis sparus]
MSTVSLEINGQTIEVPEGSTVMDAATALGIFVPHFCYHKKLSIAANCRMCLVDVEKSPKPLPACATPVSNGMKVMTHSPKAIDSQKGVMGFLLINHPLDCPICDQGGECQLQDLAVGYGSSSSIYTEEKRVVANKNLGSLISTDMTRCIHCTRCVRFGEEVAGIKELGVIGRGEHSEITTFLSSAVSSEVSGNVIDLCPVGALTSKPFRYSARTWELSRRRSISPHDSLGSNMIVQVKLNTVYRVLPLENENINQCWISDRDRFSYPGIAEDRLLMPKIKKDGIWQTLTWDEAFDELVLILNRYSSNEIAGWAHPSSTLEELYLFQKILRKKGVKHVESRLNYGDYRRQIPDYCAPYLGTSVRDFLASSDVFIIGSFIRHEQPLIAASLRGSIRNRGTKVHRLHVTGENWLMPLETDLIVSPKSIVAVLLSILASIVRNNKYDVPPELGQILEKEGAEYSDFAKKLSSMSSLSIVLGAYAESHVDAGVIHYLSFHISRALGANFGFFGEGANAVGAYVSGAVSGEPPMLSDHKLLLLLNLDDNGADFCESRGFSRYCIKSEYVVCFSPFESASRNSHLHLPIASPYETDGTYINMEGVWQTFYAAAQPATHVKSAWKVLRRLGNILFGNDFSYDNCQDIQGEIKSSWGDRGGRFSNDLPVFAPSISSVFATDHAGLSCVSYRHAYNTDGVVRRSAPLQNSAMAWKDNLARVSPLSAQLFSIVDGEQRMLRQGEFRFEAKVCVDPNVVDGTIVVESGCLPSLSQTVYVE